MCKFRRVLAVIRCVDASTECVARSPGHFDLIVIVLF